MADIAWGMLGTARITRRLIPAMRAAGRSRVVAVGSRQAEAGAVFAREWDIPHATAGYDALLERDDITAVYIPLPNSLHVEWTLRAIARGKHVLCEKPFAVDPADIDRIAAASRRTGLVATEGFMYRHEPLTTRVAALVRDGAIGAVRAVSSGFTYLQSRPNDVRLHPGLDGGALNDIGCYPVSYACLLANRKVEGARAMASWMAEDVDEACAGLLQFEGGAVASIYAGFRAAYATWLTILGSEGTLTVPNPFKPGPREPLQLDRLGERQVIEVPGSEQLFVRQIRDFEAAVLDAQPPTVTLEDSRRVAEALSALQASARQPREVVPR